MDTVCDDVENQLHEAGRAAFRLGEKPLQRVVLVIVEQSDQLLVVLVIFCTNNKFETSELQCEMNAFIEFGWLQDVLLRRMSR